MDLKQHHHLQYYPKQRQDQPKFDDDDGDDALEALSLSDLPILGRENCAIAATNTTTTRSDVFEAEDFEFEPWVEDPLGMCAADEVFFQGQILPLRLSVSSESGQLQFKPNHLCASRSDSLDRSSGPGSCTFSTSTSTSTSRSQSLSSSSSNSNRYSFCARPSPKPQPRIGAQHQQPQQVGRTASRRSSGWRLLRLGLVRAPELELHDLRLRTKNNSSNGRRSCSSEGASDCNAKRAQSKGAPTPAQGHRRRLRQRLFGNGFNCKCSAFSDATDTIEPKPTPTIKCRQDAARQSGLRERAMSQCRTFEWLREFSIAEAPAA